MFVSPSPIPGMLQSLMVRPGREAQTTPPLGREAKSLKNGMTHHWNFRAQTNKHKGSAMLIWKPRVINRKSQIFCLGLRIQKLVKRIVDI